MTQTERIELVEEAREKLQEAIELLRQAFPNDPYVDAYMIDHLQVRVGGDDLFLSCDLNMTQLIERIEKEEEE
jgi:hypothetical protein